MQDEKKARTEGAGQIAKVVALSELSPVNNSGNKLLDGNFSVIAGVKVTVEVVVGNAELTVQELFDLQQGSVIELSQLYDAPLVVRLDGKPVATGTLVVVGEKFGIRVTEILPVADAKE